MGSDRVQGSLSEGGLGSGRAELRAQEQGIKMLTVKARCD